MEKPEVIKHYSGETYYKASEMDPYIAELKASLKEMVGYASGFHVFLLTGQMSRIMDTRLSRPTSTAHGR